MKVIGFYNQKGGCGKSTSVFQVAGFLAKANKKVLVVDADVQSNVSSSLLVNSDQLDSEESMSFCDVALGLADIKDVIQNAPIEIRAGRKPQDIGIDILPSNKVKEVRHYTDDPYVVKKALAEVSDNYDYCLIDFPPERPSNDMVNETETFNLVLMCLIATDYLIVPCSSDMDSFDGLEYVNKHLEVITSRFNTNTELLGCFLSNFHVNSTSGCFLELCEGPLSDGGIYTGCIVRNSAIISSASMKAKPLAYYFENSGPAEDYKHLADYIMSV